MPPERIPGLFLACMIGLAKREVEVAIAGAGMYLIYCDESGNTGRNLADRQQPMHLVLGLLVHETKWQAVSLEFADIKEAALVEMALPVTTELHAADLAIGKGAFRNKPRSKRNSLIEVLLQLVPHHDIKIVWGAVDKPGLAARYSAPWHPHDLAFMLVAERCQRYLASPPEYGLFIADRSPGCEGMLCSSLHDYQAKGSRIGHGGPMDRLLDTIHFVDSSESAFIQLADICAYVARRNSITSAKRDPLETHPHYAIIQPQVVASKILP